MALKKSGSKALANSPGNAAKHSADQQQVVIQAAHNVHIDPRILWGVYGVETAFGANVTTSSAGAQGPFQFEPATARQYHLANPWDFVASANASAHYLRDLGADTLGSANTRKALNSYNGNGGGTRETSYTRGVESNGKTLHIGGSALTDALNIASALTNPLGAAGEAIAGGVTGTGGIISAAGNTIHGIEAVGEMALTILNPSKWGELLANTAGVFSLKITKAVYKYAILPPWHWTERATDYYIQNELSITDTPDPNPVLDNKALVTIAFWSLGFVLLWGQVEDSEQRDPHTGQFIKKTRFGIGASERQSSLGRSVTTVINGYKNSTKLKKTAEGDNTKPILDPILSEAKISHVRSVSVHRNRTVKVQRLNNKGPENPAQTADETKVTNPRKAA